ncbi:hypothetical protein X975_12570, partial [Stegodyphus mimosarum]
MARKMNLIFLLLVACIILMISPNLCQDESDREFYDCFMFQICDCDMLGEYEKCWSISPSSFQDHSRGTMADCSSLEPASSSMYDIGKALCSHDREEAYPCFKQVVEGMKQFERDLLKRFDVKTKQQIDRAK